MRNMKKIQGHLGETMRGLGVSAPQGPVSSRRTLTPALCVRVRASAQSNIQCLVPSRGNVGPGNDAGPAYDPGPASHMAHGL